MRRTPLTTAPRRNCSIQYSVATRPAAGVRIVSWTDKWLGGNRHTSDVAETKSSPADVTTPSNARRAVERVGDATWTGERTLHAPQSHQHVQLLATPRSTRRERLRGTTVVQLIPSNTSGHDYAALCGRPSLWRGVVVSGVRRMNEVNPRRARLVLGWVTVFGRVYHLGM